MGIGFYGPDQQQGLFIGASPDWQLAQQKVAQGDAFKGGIPTTDGTPNGPVDWMAAGKKLLQKGDTAGATNIMNIGLQQQLMRSASAPSDVLGSAVPGPAAQNSPPPSGGAMPIFQNAISSIESGGKYDAQGPATNSGDQALGKYQVMASNVPSWTKEILGQEMSPQQFIANPQAQDAVFNGKFGQYLKQSGNPQHAASMWFTGRPYAQGAGAQDQLGTTGSGYVSKFMTALRSGAAAQGLQSGGAPSEAASPSTSSASSDGATPIKVAQNGAFDAPAPGSVNPYAQVDPTAMPGIGPSQGGSLGQGTPPRQQGQPAPMQVAALGAPSPPAPPMGAPPASAQKQSPATPYASNGSNFVDPTLGGLVTQEQLQTYGSYGGVAKAAVAEAVAMSNNPYAKERSAALLDYAKQIMSTVSKASELTNEQKNARDPLVLQSQEAVASTRAKARVEAMTDNALVPVAQQDGSMTLMPKRVAIQQAANGNGPVTSLPGYVTSGQQNLLTKLNDGSQAYTERQIAGERLDALSDLLSTFQTGANTTAFGDAKAKLASIGVPIPDSAMKDVASMQQFTKDAYANVLSTMREGGNKQFVSEMQSAVNSNPNVELQPAANAAMIAQMQGIRQYHDKNFQDYADWYGANKGASNDAAFQINWAKANPLASYISTAARNVAPTGVPLPPPNQLVDGQAYMVQGKGGPVKARWSATAAHFIPVGR